MGQRRRRGHLLLIGGCFWGNLKLSDIKGWKFAEKNKAAKWPTVFSDGWKVADIFF